MIRKKEEESLFGPMERNMMVNGKMESNMELVHLLALMEKLNKEDGRMEKELNGQEEVPGPRKAQKVKVKELIPTHTEILEKDSKKVNNNNNNEYNEYSKNIIYLILNQT